MIAILQLLAAMAIALGLGTTVLAACLGGLAWLLPGLFVPRARWRPLRARREPNGIIVVEGKLSAEQLQEFREQFRRAYTHPTNPLSLWEGTDG